MKPTKTKPLLTTVDPVPGMIIWGFFPSHDRGQMWHPAIILRVDKSLGRIKITAALGSTNRMKDDPTPSEFVCYREERDFAYTGLEFTTRFDMDGLIFTFPLGAYHAEIRGEISEVHTPTLCRRLMTTSQTKAH